MPMNLQPKFFPANGDLAACWILAAHELGAAAGARAGRRRQAGAVDAGARHRRRGRRCAALARDLGLDAAALAARAPADVRRVTRRSRRKRSMPAFSARRRTCIDGRNLLGTGPARLRRPQTGKIACFPGQPFHGRPGARGICRPRRVRRTGRDARRTPIHEGVRALPTYSHFSGSIPSHVHMDSSSRSCARWRRSSTASSRSAGS